MRLVLATRNKKKIAEIRRIMCDVPVSLGSLDDFPACPEVEETEATFEGNALKKAREVALFTGLPAMADDSGLVVDALDGAPGVLSARYSGPGATDQRNLRKMLDALGDTPASGRTARFVCVIALAWPDGASQTFEGKVEGTIAAGPVGESGFGYDPVFYPHGHDRTFAQMSGDEKNSMSHRGRALEKLAEYLRTLADPHIT